MQKDWRKPELIVVMRGAVEERTLMVCKFTNSMANPGSFHTGCCVDALCSQCDVETVS
jgi:hypothetical protein